MPAAIPYHEHDSIGHALAEPRGDARQRTQHMIGPVLAQELLLGSRRSRQHLFRRIYTGWLVAQLLLFYFLYLIEANLIGKWFFSGAVNPSATTDFAGSFISKLIYQQFILLLLATPAFTAGAITDEKA